MLAMTNWTCDDTEDLATYAKTPYTKSMLTKQIIKFATVGVICTGINYVTFYFLLNFLDINYLVSACLGYLLGLLVNYFMNLKWSFKYDGASKRTVVKYFAVYMFSLLLSLGLLKLFVTVFHIIPEIANLLTIGFTMVVNFCGIKFFAFRR